MCLIIEKPAELDIEDALIVSAYQNNSDGFGVMFPTGDGKIHVHRIMPKTYREIFPIYKRYKDKHCALHFRYATHGAKNISQCHPYKIFSKQSGDAFDMYLMHNGVLSMPETDKLKSDTWHFIEYFLRPMLRQNPDMIYDKTFNKVLEKIVAGSRILILDGRTGVYTKLLPTSGVEVNGLWLSNSYSTQRGLGLDYNPNSKEQQGGYFNRNDVFIPEKKTPTSLATESNKGLRKSYNLGADDYYNPYGYGYDYMDDTTPYGTTTKTTTTNDNKDSNVVPFKMGEQEKNKKENETKINEGGEQEADTFHGINPESILGLDTNELVQVYEKNPVGFMSLIKQWVN